MSRNHRNWARWLHKFRAPQDAGLLCMGLATLGLAVAWLVAGNPEFPAGPAPPIIKFVLLLVVGSAAAAILTRGRPCHWLGPILFWLALLAVGVRGAAQLPSMTAAVEPSEALVIALAIGVGNFGSVARWQSEVLAAAIAAMLILFGAIHLMEAAALSGLVPSWIPARQFVPYLTGAILVAAGVAIPVRRFRRTAALAVALLFLSWLPLLHAERLLADPGSLFEWRFALTALALAGALLIVAGPRSHSTKRI